jgi:hypothetical protein
MITIPLVPHKCVVEVQWELWDLLLPGLFTMGSSSSKVMRAAIRDGGDIKYSDTVARPELVKGQMIVRVRAAGVFRYCSLCPAAWEESGSLFPCPRH